MLSQFLSGEHRVEAEEGIVFDCGHYCFSIKKPKVNLQESRAQVIGCNRWFDILTCNPYITYGLCV